ncbi:MFS transporter [Burkholderia ubonensis]|uniref:MFS transporter n=1 Tax=Burkholderia ubonensis TaxID=101571 RepID=UPI0009B3402E|nr:MFS transporter [Burkholderia ubonensis]
MKLFANLNDLRGNWNLCFFQTGFLFINLGDRCTQLAVAWWSLRVTKSTAIFASMLAFAACAELVTRLFLGFVGDRYNKAVLIIVCNLVSAIACAVLAGLAFLGVFYPVVVALMMAVIAVATGIRDPLQSSIIPTLVVADKVSAAFGTKGMLYSLALLAGPPLAGFLITGSGEAITLLVDLIGMGVGSILIGFVLAKTFSTPNASDAYSTRGRPNPFSGLRMLFIVKVEFYLAVLAMGINFSLYPFFSMLMPYYIQHEAHLSASILGVLEAIFAVGIFCGSAWLVKHSNTLIGRDRSVALGFGLLACNMGAVYFSNYLYVLLVAFFLGGLGLVLININTSSVRALATPASHLNQMMSAVSFLSMAINPVGSLVAGGLVVAIGFKATLAGLIAMTAASALAIPLVTPVRYFLSKPDTELRESYGSVYPDAFR